MRIGGNRLSVRWNWIEFAPLIARPLLLNPQYSSYHNFDISQIWRGSIPESINRRENNRTYYLGYGMGFGKSARAIMRVIIIR